MFHFADAALKRRSSPSNRVELRSTDSRGGCPHIQPTLCCAGGGAGEREVLRLRNAIQKANRVPALRMTDVLEGLTGIVGWAVVQKRVELARPDNRGGCA